MQEVFFFAVTMGYGEALYTTIRRRFAGLFERSDEPEQANQESYTAGTSKAGSEQGPKYWSIQYIEIIDNYEEEAYIISENDPEKARRLLQSTIYTYLTAVSNFSKKNKREAEAIKQARRKSQQQNS